MKTILMLSFVAGVALLQGCAAKTNNDAPPPPQVNKNIGMANPADVYCTKLGGKLNGRQNAQGQYSTCTLPNGQEMDSWELFRRDHPVKK
ncbi:putative hemolysin [Serratia sp. L9]|uniref:putative hemolysin n=1 Tax=Serratia sp. L9 TaxID=3423946 RepID=UPI003D668C3B